MRLEDVQTLERRWKERFGCACPLTDGPCLSCKDMQAAISRGGWREVQKALGDPVEELRRGCCGS